MTNEKQTGRRAFAAFAYLSLIHAFAYLAFADYVIAKDMRRSRKQPLPVYRALLPEDRNLIRDLSMIPEERRYRADQALQAEIDAMNIPRDLISASDSR